MEMQRANPGAKVGRCTISSKKKENSDFTYILPIFASSCYTVLYVAVNI